MSLKIYFCGSIRGGRQDASLYAKIIEQLKSYGKVLTEHVGNPNMTSDGDLEKEISDKGIHDRDVGWLEECDAVVAEVTQVSLGVGYEIGRAVALNKRILCLYRPSEGKRLSAMIGGLHDGKTNIIRHYKEEDVPQILKDFFGA